jgi:hypothetical protein
MSLFGGHLGPPPAGLTSAPNRRDGPSMTTSSLSLVLCLAVATTACKGDGDRPAETAPAPPTGAPAASEPAGTQPSTTAALASDVAKGDPLLLAICRAHDEVAAEGVAPEILLQSTAVRSMERHGVTEAQMSELGATPAALLASIRSRGAPPACAGLIAALEARL